MRRPQFVSNRFFQQAWRRTLRAWAVSLATMAILFVSLPASDFAPFTSNRLVILPPAQTQSVQPEP